MDGRRQAVAVRWVAISCPAAIERRALARARRSLSSQEPVLAIVNTHMCQRPWPSAPTVALLIPQTLHRVELCCAASGVKAKDHAYTYGYRKGEQYRCDGKARDDASACAKLI